MQITLYTKRNCSLCDSLKADLLAIQPEIGFVLLEYDIEQEPVGELGDASVRDLAKLERYRNLIPVLDIEGGTVLYSPISYDALFDAIDDAAKAAS